MDGTTHLMPGRPTDGRPPSSLPPELLASGRARLGTFALFMAALFLVIAVVVQAVPWDVETAVPGWGGTSAELRFRVAAVQLAAVALHLLMYWIVRSPRFPHVFAMGAGLVYEVIVCLLITMSDQWLSYTSDGRFQDLTFAALIIVIFPLFVPSAPRKTVVGALAAASTLALGLWALRFSGIVATFEDYFIATLTGIVCAAIAVVGSVIIHGLHKAVVEARELGAYRLETLLGSGGMGEVWRASHRLLARPAAVKVVRPEFLGARTTDEASRALQRFEREAQATAMLSSPHTIALYDFGIAADGTFYYVMELLDGIDLGTLVTQYGPVPAERAAALIIQLCDSLGEAHESGLIHRDVKPANVFVCRYGRKVDFIKVLDFGLVKPTDSTDAALTQDRSVGGTPAFMPPEQVLGDRPVDARTDVYAAGCVAYWLLTGRLVFDGPSPMAIMMSHARSEPVPPSSVTELPVPAAMDEVVMACLAKDPDARPQSVDDMAARLHATGLAGDWTAARAADWWARHRPASA